MTKASVPTLAVSIVVYAPDHGIIMKTLASLNQAVVYGKTHGALGRVQAYWINNGPDSHSEAWLREFLQIQTVLGFDTVRIFSKQGNIGYGAGHNLAIAQNDSDYHLILNPDVVVAEDALYCAMQFMESNPSAGLLVPSVVDGECNRQYLCKRYPAVMDLFLRGFAPTLLRRFFRERLERYELRDVVANQIVWDIPLASGCFMLLRGKALRKIEGFSSRYFLYFEDFDLSLRLAKVARIVFVPTVKIVHFGGNTAKKGFSHIMMFMRSAYVFFGHHGWKWI